MTAVIPETQSAPPSPLRPTATAVTVVVLAGGLGRRMGNADKGLELLQGRALVSWVLGRMTAQAGEILISANRNHDIYGKFGHRVVADRIAGFAGPLAGMHAGLSEAAHELVAFVPCDTPLLPENLIAKLLAPLGDDRVDVSLAKTGTQPHPVICVTRRRLRVRLEAFLASGGRKVDGWFATLNAVQVAFDDQPGAFRNINTVEELHAIPGDSG
ncbi:MAG: molybdenum cofactor guanylyltransferase MobA [Betaproteobacteria bacterium]|jgi:molybdopterin-guanine dinucleotide biosynthesis protein A